MHAHFLVSLNCVLYYIIIGKGWKTPTTFFDHLGPPSWGVFKGFCLCCCFQTLSIFKGFGKCLKTGETTKSLEYGRGYTGGIQKVSRNWENPLRPKASLTWGDVYPFRCLDIGTLPSYPPSLLYTWGWGHSSWEYGDLEIVNDDADLWPCRIYHRGWL